MITPAVWKSPFQINTTTTGTQAYGQLGASSDGSYYSVWIDFSTGSGRVIGRKIGASGTALAGEVVMEGAATGDSFPDLAVTPDNKPHAVFSFGNDTYVGNYSTALGSASFTAIETGGSTSTHPAITAFADGSLFVTYTLQNSGTDYDILGQRVSAAGALVGGPITIFDDTDQTDFSQLATLDNGNFVVVYESQFVGSATDHDVFFQIRKQDGTSVKGSTGVGTTGVLDTEAEVAALHTGGFVVAWTKGTGSAADIRAKIYDKDGNLVRAEFGVATTTTGQQGESHVTAMDDGGFLVTWEDNNLNNQKAQRFDSSGNKIGQEVVTHVGDVFHTSVATLADGRTVMSFDDFSAGNYNVFNEIFDTRTNVTGHATGHDLFGDGTADQLILRTSPGAAGSSSGGVLTMFALSPSGGLTQIGQVGADWSVAGSGDLNGDGRNDIVMQHDVGSIREIYSFTMGATQVVGITKIGEVGLDWQIDGSGDFNGDGFKDILVERINAGVKELTVLGVKSGTTNSVTLAGQLTPSSYQVDGIGDMNGDGVADVLTHYDDATGRHFVGLNMGSYTTQSVTSVANIGVEWNAVGMGDFNGDGRADILITTDTGTARDIGLLINQGGSFVFKDLGPLVGKNVQIDGIGDFNGDGTADVSFHFDPTGAARTNAYFEMHDAAVTAINTTGSVGHEWIVT